MEKQVKDAITELYEMMSAMEDCISLLQTAFIYNTRTLLEDCRLKSMGVKKVQQQITTRIEELTRDNSDLRPYIIVPPHLFGIRENLDRLAELIDKKVKENILFSDRAISEITFLLQRLADILKSTADMILARNIFLCKYVEESEAGVIRRAIEYSTYHEERLIEGLCLPVASSIYVKMMDAIKAIAWHSKEIVRGLT